MPEPALALVMAKALWPCVSTAASSRARTSWIDSAVRSESTAVALPARIDGTVPTSGASRPARTSRSGLDATGRPATPPPARGARAPAAHRHPRSPAFDPPPIDHGNRGHRHRVIQHPRTAPAPAAHASIGSTACPAHRSVGAIVSASGQQRAFEVRLFRSASVASSRSRRFRIWSSRRPRSRSCAASNKHLARQVRPVDGQLDQRLRGLGLLDPPVDHTQFEHQADHRRRVPPHAIVQ